jgi:hypothetical protein
MSVLCPRADTPTAPAGPARGLLGAASLARTAQQPPGLQPGERIIDNRRTGRNERGMGIALGGGQAAIGRLELERVALAAFDRDDVRDTGCDAHALEDRGLDAGAPAKQALCLPAIECSWCWAIP